MSNYNPKDFDIREEIAKRVQKEDMYYWARNFQPIPIPEYQKPPKIKRSVGLWNMFKELKP